jgi:hypothetical protein
MHEGRRFDAAGIIFEKDGFLMKRLMDVALAIFGLIVLAPALLYLVSRIRREMGSEPEKFISNPIHQMSGLHTWFYAYAYDW